VKNLIMLNVFIILTASLISCTNNQVGTVGGAAVGGVVGNAVTGGSTAGTVAGAVGGGIIGHEVTR
jgi:osmotically inducible lipoprotein OsmB